MATIVTCDGCNTPVTEPKRIGHVTPREYCEACAKRADDFQADEEALRKNLHDKFVADRAELIAKFSENGFQLPDIA